MPLSLNDVDPDFFNVLGVLYTNLKSSWTSTAHRLSFSSHSSKFINRFNSFLQVQAGVKDLNWMTVECRFGLSISVTFKKSLERRKDINNVVLKLGEWNYFCLAGELNCWTEMTTHVFMLNVAPYRTFHNFWGLEKRRYTRILCC